MRECLQDLPNYSTLQCLGMLVRDCALKHVIALTKLAQGAGMWVKASDLKHVVALN
jgi:hypothetical protein